MKVQFIGVGSDNIEYTDELPIEDGGCIKQYDEQPSDEQLEKDIGECLLNLQFEFLEFDFSLI